MRIAELRNAQGKVWLNVASSSYPIADFANLDNHILLWALRYPVLRPLVPRRNRNMLAKYEEGAKIAPFFRHDCRRALPLPAGTVDHILCSHFLEHVFPDEADAILRDFHRVLRPGATAHIVVPDISAHVDGYVAARGTDALAADRFVETTLLSKRNRGTLRYRLMELSGGFGLQHRWMYDTASMTDRVVRAGFEVIDGNATPSAHWRAGDDSVHVVARRPELSPGVPA